MCIAINFDGNIGEKELPNLVVCYILNKQEIQCNIAAPTGAARCAVATVNTVTS